MSWKPDVIIITSDEVYSKMWHTQIIYTRFLATLTNVIYINPPERWLPGSVFRTTQKLEIINDKLSICSYQNILPAVFPFALTINDLYNSRAIFTLLKAKKYRSVLFWQFDSYRGVFADLKFQREFKMKRIYHVIDPFYNNPLNDKLSRLADLIILTSKRNEKYYQPYNHKLLHIPQAIEQTTIKPALSDQPSPSATGKFIVLLGTISDDLDFDWLLSIARQNDLQLLLIGKIVALNKEKSKYKKLLELKNVRYLGLMAPEEFYPIIQNAEAGLIVYNEERRSKICSPLKALNYLAASIPTISNIDTEIPELEGQCIFTVSTFSEFSTTIKTIRKGGSRFNTALAGTYLNKTSLPNSVDLIFKRLGA